jgi:hypothetical protein
VTGIVTDLVLAVDGSNGRVATPHPLRNVVESHIRSGKKAYDAVNLKVI